jgi:hypothetical protein
MADAVEAGELLDVEMDEFAGTLAMVAANRLGRDDRFLSPALPSASSGRATCAPSAR